MEEHGGTLDVESVLLTVLRVRGVVTCGRDRSEREQRDKHHFVKDGVEAHGNLAASCTVGSPSFSCLAGNHDQAHQAHDEEERLPP